MELIKNKNNVYHLIYESEELKEHSIDVKSFTKDHESHQFQNAITQLYDMISKDIIKAKLFTGDCCCEIYFQMAEDLSHLLVEVKENTDNEVEKKKREEKRGYVYIKINSPFDAAMASDIYEESSILKTTEGEYILRVLAKNMELAKIQLADIGDFVSYPKNWNVLVKENAIEQMKNAMK